MAEDNWGRDPAVQQMRRVFAGMEQIQETILNQAGINPFDGRLRSVREAAFRLFERATSLSAGKGISLSDNIMIEIYAACLHQTMTNAGIAISRDLLSDDRSVRELLREVSR